MNTAKLLIAARFAEPLVGTETVRQRPGLVAFWSFDEPVGQPLVSTVGDHTYALTERAGPVTRLAEGPINGTSIRFSGFNYLAVPRAELDSTPLDIKGPDARVTVIAWVRRAQKTAGDDGPNWWHMEFLGGLWDEDGRRQYGLFLNEAQKQRISGHISDVGGGTGSGEFNTTFALGASTVPFFSWHKIALTHDGAHIRVYLDGKLDGILPFPHGIYDPAVAPPNSYPDAGPIPGADFSIGAVWAKGGLPTFIMRNFFKGDLSGLAVFNRALSDAEMREIHQAIPLR